MSEVSLVDMAHVANPSPGVTYSAQPNAAAAVPQQLASSSIGNPVQVSNTVKSQQVLPATPYPRQVIITNVGQARVFIVSPSGQAPNGIPIAIGDTFIMTTDQSIYLACNNVQYPGMVVICG